MFFSEERSQFALQGDSAHAEEFSSRPGPWVQGAKPRSASAFTVDHFRHYILARVATCAAALSVAVAQVASMYAAEACISGWILAAYDSDVTVVNDLDIRRTTRISCAIMISECHDSDTVRLGGILQHDSAYDIIHSNDSDIVLCQHT